MSRVRKLVQIAAAAECKGIPKLAGVMARRASWWQGVLLGLGNASLEGGMQRGTAILCRDLVEQVQLQHFVHKFLPRAIVVLGVAIRTTRL